MRPWRGVQWGALRPMLLALPLLLAGCASTAIQENQAATSAFASREVGQEVQLQSTPEARTAAESKTRDLLAEPLTAEGAVQIALGYSPTFQRMLADSAAASPTCSRRSIDCAVQVT
jgi:type II secretory pathway component PulL